ncbi:trimethylamine methyltransferase [Rhodophyticola sp. CCM32]|uniref:trimethylamine methyltransferase family protein n=1 Tax=Rhodophyticola sp. CCM32 TaxID=2916397 RepID=UPI00107F5745|nr:trimethylamine methyltransferase family protein [Rhodophyticola sp. CCM32]QBY00894.1 trimethylamine methyltransferase [Rhodophyticola sp. CCM32]
MVEIEAKGRRGGGRRRRDNAATNTVARQPNYRQLRHPFSPQTVFSEDEVQSIHNTALRVIEELGIKVLLPEAREIFAKAGARVDDDEMVFIGRDVVEAAIESAPSSIPLRSINPARQQIYENGAMLFMAGAGCPNATDFERGRRAGDLGAYEETIKLAQHFDVLHMFGPAVEPQNVAAHLRHYDMMRAQMEFGDKPMFVYSRGRAQVQQSFEMIQIAQNLSSDDFAEGVWASSVINSNSPRMLDNPMAQGLIDFARAGQMTIITPFCLAGAMAPVTVAGALTLQHAEAMAGITLAQLAKSGAPISYGGFSSNVDMKSGSPAFGTPEHIKMQIGAGQLARHINLPWRSASGAASNTPDMQAATETNMSLWGAANANATLTVHSAGWLEGGLSFGYEKFINDIEALQTLAEMCTKPSGSDAEIGWDALADVQPGGHFFATQHTMDRYQTAFYSPLVADLQNFGAWEDAGSQTSAQRATGIWKQILAEFTPAPTGAEAKERLMPYIEKKTAEGGAALLD